MSSKSISQSSFLQLSTDKQPEQYRSWTENEAQTIKRVVKSEGRASVIIYGGDKINDEDLLKKTDSWLKLAVLVSSIVAIYGNDR